MVWVDGSDLEGMLTLLDNLTIFRDFCNFSMAAVDGLQEVILIVHSLDGVFDVFEILFIVRIALDQPDHFIPLLYGNGQTEFEQSQMLHIHTPAHDLIINIQPDLTQFYTYNPANKPAKKILFPNNLSIWIKLSIVYFTVLLRIIIIYKSSGCFLTATHTILVWVPPFLFSSGSSHDDSHDHPRRQHHHQPPRGPK